MKRPKPWREWTTVERVELYSQVSLTGATWLFPVVILVLRKDTLTHGFWQTGSFISDVVLPLLVATLLIQGTYKDNPRREHVQWVLLLMLAALPLPTLILRSPPPNEQDVITALTSWFAVVSALSTVRDRRLLAFLVPVAIGIPWLATREPTSSVIGVAAVAFILFATRTALWLHDAVAELDVARTIQADLAVAEERLRFSRDVHDVLGRRLSAIALQAELAARLSERRDAGAPERMLEVRATAHEALREARELARGYRPVDLGQEVEGARSLLAAAGIELDARLDDLPESAHEAAAWVVRETLTNVLRHSDARLVVLTWRSPWLVVVNDRPNPTSDAGDGAGLAGLEERLTARGGALETTRDHDYFTVRARLPLDEPAIAGAAAP